MVNIMLRTLPKVCDYYNIRRPIFHLPFIKHSFAEQRLDYQLIKKLNVHGSMLYARKVKHSFFYAFKTFVQYEILNRTQNSELRSLFNIKYEELAI